MPNRTPAHHLLVLFSYTFHAQSYVTTTRNVARLESSIQKVRPSWSFWSTVWAAYLTTAWRTLTWRTRQKVENNSSVGLDVVSASLLSVSNTVWRVWRVLPSYLQHAQAPGVPGYIGVRVLCYLILCGYRLLLRSSSVVGHTWTAERWCCVGVITMASWRNIWRTFSFLVTPGNPFDHY